MGNGSQTTRGAQTGYTAYNMDAPQNSVGEFSVGSEDGQRQITNVAAGSADTDAVDVGQLKVTDAQVSQNTQSITNLNNQVTDLDLALLISKTVLAISSPPVAPSISRPIPMV